MAVDYQVVFPVEVIKLSAIKLVFGSFPYTLDITGQDFRAVDTVVVNDQNAAGWSVISKTRLLAVLPEGMQPAQVASINVTSRSLTLSDRSILKFQISEVPAKVSGILRLTQLYVKILLTTPGSDIYDKQTGGGVLSFLGSTAYGGETGDLVRRFVVANDRVSRQIISIQSRQPSLPPDEKLLAAKVLSARFSRQQSALLANVELTNQAGRSALTNVVF